jgi:hypothetical protein
MPLNLSLPANFSAAGSASGSFQFSTGSRRAPAPAAAPHAKAYVSNGYVMNSNGYLANPTRAAQIAANNAGALTGAEAARMGLPLAGRR